MKSHSLGTTDPKNLKSVKLFKGNLCIDLCSFLFVCFSSFICVHFPDKENELMRKHGSSIERMTGSVKRTATHELCSAACEGSAWDKLTSESYHYGLFTEGTK